jgi:hypothetical protein
MKILQPFLRLWLPRSPIQNLFWYHIYQSVWLWDEENWGSLKRRPRAVGAAAVALRKDLIRNARPLYEGLLSSTMAVAPTELPTPLLWALQKGVEGDPGSMNALEERPVTPRELVYASRLLPGGKSIRLQKSALYWWLLGLPEEILSEKLGKEGDDLFEFMAEAIQPTAALKYWVVSPHEGGYKRLHLQDRVEKPYIRAQLRAGRAFVPRERRKYHTTVLFDSMEHKQEWLEGGSQCAEGYKRYRDGRRRDGKRGRTPTGNARPTT